MSRQSRTPDERFLIVLFEIAKDKPVDSKDVANTAKIKEKAAKTIIRSLAQANFIKKLGDGKITITTQGIAFVENELHSSR